MRSPDRLSTVIVVLASLLIAHPAAASHFQSLPIASHSTIDLGKRGFSINPFTGAPAVIYNASDFDTSQHNALLLSTLTAGTWQTDTVTSGATPGPPLVFQQTGEPATMIFGVYAFRQSGVWQGEPAGVQNDLDTRPSLVYDLTIDTPSALFRYATPSPGQPNSAELHYIQRTQPSQWSLSVLINDLGIDESYDMVIGPGGSYQMASVGYDLGPPIGPNRLLWSSSQFVGPGTIDMSSFGTSPVIAWDPLLGTPDLAWVRTSIDGAGTYIAYWREINDVWFETTVDSIGADKGGFTIYGIAVDSLGNDHICYSLFRNRSDDPNAKNAIVYGFRPPPLQAPDGATAALAVQQPFALDTVAATGSLGGFDAFYHGSLALAGQGPGAARIAFVESSADGSSTTLFYATPGPALAVGDPRPRLTLGMRVYPTPTWKGSTATVALGADLLDVDHLELYDVSGRMVRSAAVASSALAAPREIGVSTAGLRDGVYFMRAMRSGKTVGGARLVVFN